MKAAEEKLLHSGADVAEAMTTLSVEMLGTLEHLEALPAEQWDAMEPMQRKNTYDALLELREAQPQILAELPLDVRREWEQRLGNRGGLQDLQRVGGKTHSFLGRMRVD